MNVRNIASRRKSKDKSKHDQTRSLGANCKSDSKNVEDTDKEEDDKCIVPTLKIGIKTWDPASEDGTGI